MQVPELILKVCCTFRSVFDSWQLAWNSLSSFLGKILEVVCHCFLARAERQRLAGLDLTISQFLACYLNYYTKPALDVKGAINKISLLLPSPSLSFSSLKLRLFFKFTMAVGTVWAMTQWITKAELRKLGLTSRASPTIRQDKKAASGSTLKEHHC